MGPNTNYTLVVTSCDRHDLLKQTLESYFRVVDQPPREVLVIEDSAAVVPEFLKDFVWRQRSLKWISNGERRGQIFSIDRAYREVKTEFIMHCEDDWLFEQGSFVTESKAILAAYPEIAQVSLRGDTGWHPLARDPKYPFWIAAPYWRGVWGGIAFNPGMRRTSDYKKLGSYGMHVSFGKNGLQHEEALSKKLLDQGFRMADLGRPICTHIGGGRSRAIEPLPRPRKILIAVPACHQFDYGRWESEDSPSYDQRKAWEGRPYGTDIHISGPNPRIEVIRQTWGKDVETFKEHVDLRFFYGEPYQQAFAKDEIPLRCLGDYAHLPQKTVEICRWALAQGYDYVFKCDDDTAVYVDRLIMEPMTTTFDYAGYLNGNVCSGGPGYWLSKRAMQFVVTNPMLSHWAEDVMVGKIMHAAGIEPFMLSGHRPGFSAHWFFPDGFEVSRLTDDVVTMHALAPREMRDWHAHIKSGELAAA